MVGNTCPWLSCDSEGKAEPRVDAHSICCTNCCSNNWHRDADAQENWRIDEQQRAGDAHLGADARDGVTDDARWCADAGEERCGPARCDAGVAEEAERRAVEEGGEGGASDAAQA